MKSAMEGLWGLSFWVPPGVKLLWIRLLKGEGLEEGMGGGVGAGLAASGAALGAGLDGSSVREAFMASLSPGIFGMEAALEELGFAALLMAERVWTPAVLVGFVAGASFGGGAEGEPSMGVRMTSRESPFFTGSVNSAGCWFTSRVNFMRLVAAGGWKFTASSASLTVVAVRSERT